MKGEIRAPHKLVRNSLATMNIKLLWVLLYAKMQGPHRTELKAIGRDLKIPPRTLGRITEKLKVMGWAGCDKKYLFPRSWEKLGYNRTGGMYLSKLQGDVKRFEGYCFAFALGKIIGRVKGSLRSRKRRTMQNADLSTTYLARALGLKTRRYEKLKACGQRYKYLSSIPQFKIIGKTAEYEQFKKHLHGVPVFKRGAHTVTPATAKIRVLI